MGAAESTTAFADVWAALPPAALERAAALAAKESDALLAAHPAAPKPNPEVPYGVCVQLDKQAARAALACVPRLQRKHYELIPKKLAELTFWEHFFSHLTVIATEEAPQLLTREVEMWKGEAPTGTFAAAWDGLPEEKRAAVAALATRESSALTSPPANAPAAFPIIPLGYENFVDECDAVYALQQVPALQAKLSVLVPKKLTEKQFWTNFFSLATMAMR